MCHKTILDISLGKYKGIFYYIINTTMYALIVDTYFVLN